jgi:AraC family transcriptional regulator
MTRPLNRSTFYSGRFEPFELGFDRARADVTVDISPSASVKRHCAGPSGFLAETIFAPAGGRIELRFHAPTHLLVMYDEGARKSGETCIEGLSPSNLRHFADKLTFVPAGRAYHEWHEVSTPTRLSTLYLDPTKLKHAPNRDTLYVPRILFEDSILWKTASKLKHIIEKGFVRTDYLEAVAQVLLHELPRSEQNPVCARQLSRGGLATWQMHAVTKYLEQHLSEQISLAMLARITRLSEQHFCRSFKKSFGVPPHQFHVQRRVESAKRLLADRSNSITDIALGLGYSQTSAFSVAFRKTTGQSPREFRRDFV